MQATLKGVNQLTLLWFVNRLVVEMLFGCVNLLCVQRVLLINHVVVISYCDDYIRNLGSLSFYGLYILYNFAVCL